MARFLNFECVTIMVYKVILNCLCRRDCIPVPVLYHLSCSVKMVSNYKTNLYGDVRRYKRKWENG